MHPYLAKSQAWTYQLRLLMGYPAEAPIRHTIGFSSSGPRTALQAMDVTNIAAELGRDMVHVEIGLADEEPTGVALAIRYTNRVAWVPGCILYAASETAKVELLGGFRRWCVGQRNMLTSNKIPPRDRWRKGNEIALRRWRHAVATSAPVQLVGSRFTLANGRYADAVPSELITTAA